MLKYPDAPCPRQDFPCDGRIPINLDHCPTCHHQVQAPNVRMAEHPEEKAALQLRFSNAQAHSQHTGTEHEWLQLLTCLQQTQAVINLDIDTLEKLLSSSSVLYASYQQQVQAGTRTPAAFEHDANRLAVESRLYGSFGKRIIYAALSPDENGLWSYGEVTIILKPASIAHRASILEENSYDFMRRHRIPVIDPVFPLGYRSNWGDRHLLGSAKLAKDLKPGMTSSQLKALVIHSSGDRSLDNFLEIHIFDTFDHRAIARIARQGTAPSPKTKRAGLLWRGVLEKAKKLNIPI
jgi:hypothetical protein